MTPDEYYRGIEAVCGLVIELWDIIVIAAQCYDVTSIRLLPSSESTPSKNPDRYEIRLAPLRSGVHVFSLTGAAIGLPNAEPHIQRAVLMHNHCVTSWVVLRKILEKLLHIVTSMIIIEFVYVVPKPLVEIHMDGNSPVGLHSIFHIRTPYRTFVFDPTGEQFGFKREERLCGKEDYKKRCVCPKDQCDDPQWETIERDKVRQERSYLKKLSENRKNNFWEETMAHLTTVVDEWEDRTRGGIRTFHLFSNDEKREVLKSFSMKMKSDKMRSWSRKWIASQ